MKNILILLAFLASPVYGEGYWGAFDILTPPATTSDAIVLSDHTATGKTAQAWFSGVATECFTGTAAWLNCTPETQSTIEALGFVTGAHTTDTNTNAATECTGTNVLEGSGACVVNGGGGAVDSVNGQIGVVVLDADDIAETTRKYVSQAQKDAFHAVVTAIPHADTTGRTSSDHHVKTPVSDLVYSGSWDNDTGAGSKNAIYDKIETLTAGAGWPGDIIIASSAPASCTYSEAAPEFYWHPVEGNLYICNVSEDWVFAMAAYALENLSDVGTVLYTNRFALMADGDSYEARALVEADISNLAHTTDTNTNAVTECTGVELYDASGSCVAMAGGGTGDVSGPGATTTSGDLPIWNGTSGTQLATSNVSIAEIRARVTHTGTQTVSTISDFDIEVASNTAVAANTLASHPQNHTVVSHSDTTATGAELDELTDSSETTLHSHDYGDMNDVVDDTSPTLGGDLDVGTFDIVGTNVTLSGANVVLDGSNSNAVRLPDNLGAGSFRILDSNGLVMHETFSDGDTHVRNDFTLGGTVDGRDVLDDGQAGDNLITLSGVARDATHNGTFTGSTIVDSSTTKVALQALETAVESAGGGSIEVQDEGSSLTTAVTKFNFVGTGVTVTEPVADEVQVTIVSGGAPVDSVNAQTGVVVLDADDLSDTSTTNKFTTSAEISKLSGIEASADVTDTANVTSAGALMDSEVDADIKTLSLPANTTISAYGATLTDDANAAAARSTLDVDQAGTDNSTNVSLTGAPDYITISGQVITRGLVNLGTDITGNLTTANITNLSGTNAGDQTSIVGITGTKAQFDTAVTDGNIMYDGDAPTAHNHTLSNVTDSGTAAAIDMHVGTSAPGSPSTNDIWVDTN